MNFPGWIEGLNGPTGIMIGAGRGVIRSMHCNPKYRSEAMPVDITINACIASAFKRSTMKTNDVFYCNISDSRSDQVSWGESIEMGKQMFYEHPLCLSLWYPAGSVKANYYNHLFCVIFFHYLPAYIIDFLLLITRQKPLYVKWLNLNTIKNNYLFILLQFSECSKARKSRIKSTAILHN